MSNDASASDFEIKERRTDKSVDELLHQNEYTPEELARLLDLPLSLIEHEAFAGNLKALIIEHRVVSIPREEAIAWMNDRV